MTGRKRNTSPAAEAKLKELGAHHDARMEAKRTVERRIREQVEAELGPMYVREAILAAEAKAAGAPITRIAREGLATTATITAYKMIEEGERYLAGASDAPQASPFTSFDNGEIAYKPVPEELTPIAQKLGLTAAQIADASSATFRVKDGLIEAVTPALLPEGGMHPVVALVMADGSKHGRALLEFASKNN